MIRANPLLFLIASLGQGVQASPSVRPQPYLDGYNALNPAVLTQIGVCQIVQVDGEPSVERRDVSEPDGDAHPRMFLRWNARAIAGKGLAAERTYRLWMPAQSGAPGTPTMASGRYLAIGWLAPRGKPLPAKVNVASEIRAGRAKPAIVGTGEDDVFLVGLFPTTERSATNGEGMVLRSIARTLASTQDPQGVRDLSLVLAGFRGDPPPYDTIEGRPCTEWVKETLVPDLAKANLEAPVRRFRLGGLAVRDADESARLAFWKEVPSMLKALEPGDPADLSFLSELDLVRGLPADDVLEVALGSPKLLQSVLHSETQKPSLDKQKRLLQYLDAAPSGLRAQIYNEFAHWYGEYDRSTRSYLPAEASNARQEVVENEEALRKYWTGRIFGGAAP